MSVTLYSDGAASGNPGPGGYGVVLESGKHRKELWGGYRMTTNNRMELLAVIRGLEALKLAMTVDLYSDSQYVLKGLSEWLNGWKRAGWKTADRKPVKNQDLWQRLDVLIQTHAVRFHWVRGHSGHPDNERCDALAVAARDAARRGHVPQDSQPQRW